MDGSSSGEMLHIRLFWREINEFDQHTIFLINAFLVIATRSPVASTSDLCEGHTVKLFYNQSPRKETSQTVTAKGAIREATKAENIAIKDKSYSSQLPPAPPCLCICPDRTLF